MPATLINFRQFWRLSQRGVAGECSKHSNQTWLSDKNQIQMNGIKKCSGKSKAFNRWETRSLVVFAHTVLCLWVSPSSRKQPSTQSFPFHLSCNLLEPNKLKRTQRKHSTDANKFTVEFVFIAELWGMDLFPFLLGLADASMEIEYRRHIIASLHDKWKSCAVFISDPSNRVSR